MKNFLLSLAKFMGCVAFVLAVASCGAREPYDDSDAAPLRSGMVIMTDALTGCQYLRTQWVGGMTPRMDAYGKQVCKSK